jgi:uncharacterized protein YecE (DUF72 family)
VDARVGLSGWNYAHWRDGVFYPPRLPAARWLEFYAERFDTVEVNSTFYRLPRRDAVAHWVEQTPAGFLFEGWSRTLRGRARRGDVCAYFNNDWEGFAPPNAATLQGLLA